MENDPQVEEEKVPAIVPPPKKQLYQPEHVPNRLRMILTNDHSYLDQFSLSNLQHTELVTDKRFVIGSIQQMLDELHFKRDEKKQSFMELVQKNIRRKDKNVKSITTKVSEFVDISEHPSPEDFIFEEPDPKKLKEEEKGEEKEEEKEVGEAEGNTEEIQPQEEEKTAGLKFEPKAVA